ncbi:MAG: hypothetical protein COB54_02280 [Alphaproteobacteria bacterium]|nr:MAG: hypothetical protein COB54_02280 [Alphaproteobacteria bacterium]
MGTVLDYYESDNKTLSMNTKLSLYSPSGVEIGQTIRVKVHLLSEACSKFISIYSGAEVHISALEKHLEFPAINGCDLNKLMGQKENMSFEMSLHGGDMVSEKTMLFSKKIIIYVDLELLVKESVHLQNHGKSQGLNIEIRDVKYANERSKTERPLAFISHSKKDSRDFAINLANKLAAKGCPVWFDEYSLNVGDSLIESIERGMKITDKCILVLSPEFLADEGWCKHEFKTASMKQIFEKRKVMLPIWSGVQKQDVYDYSPALVDTFGLDTSSHSIEVMVDKLSKVLLEKNRNQ